MESFCLKCLHFHFDARLNEHFSRLAADLAGHRIFEAEMRSVEIRISDVGECKQPVKPICQFWNLFKSVVRTRTSYRSEQPLKCAG